ncbi:MAG: tail fiber domain-containing protein, partial [Verrucomicrobia bacterium]|nr:tail fiber domain-containing protein [Verrucomicrobiota bacterium]
HNNTTGSDNAVLGDRAGLNLTTGDNNIMIGSNTAGPTGGSNNIHIGTLGGSFSAESNTIRIGNGISSTFISGIHGATSSSGIAVYVNTSGQLGTLTSSARYKEEIATIDEKTKTALMQLRPVTFLYKDGVDDGSRTKQYGLIAEEVAQVMPDLVARNADGSIETVRYQFLAPILLGEMQQQQRTIDSQSAEIAELKRRLDDLAKLVGAGSSR